MVAKSLLNRGFHQSITSNSTISQLNRWSIYSKSVIIFFSSCASTAPKMMKLISQCIELLMLQLFVSFAFSEISKADHLTK